VIRAALNGGSRARNQVGTTRIRADHVGDCGDFEPGLGACCRSFVAAR
jgi:hypothetical protein